MRKTDGLPDTAQAAWKALYGAFRAEYKGADCPHPDVAAVRAIESAVRKRRSHAGFALRVGKTLASMAWARPMPVRPLQRLEWRVEYYTARNRTATVERAKALPVRVRTAALEAAEDYTGLAARRLINRVYRNHDESHLWPVNGRFNATERAIRAVRRAERRGMLLDDGLEYAMAIEWHLSKIVNSL